MTRSSYLQHAPAEEQQPPEQSLHEQESPQEHPEPAHEQSSQEQSPPEQQAQPGAQEAQHAPASTLVSAEVGMKIDAALTARTANEEAMDNMGNSPTSAA